MTHCPMSTAYHLSEARFRKYQPFLAEALAAPGTDITVPLNGAKPDYLAKSLREAIRSWRAYKWTNVPWTEKHFANASPVIRIDRTGTVTIHTKHGTPSAANTFIEQPSEVVPSGTPLKHLEERIRLSAAANKPLQILSPIDQSVFDLLANLQAELDIHWSPQPNGTLIVL